MSLRGHERAPVEHVILFLSSGDFVSEVLVIMSVEKRFRRCVDPCQHFLTSDDTHDLCVMCLGEEHARSVLEGMECAHCELFSLGELRSRMSLFSRELGQSSAPRGSGPAAAEAAMRLRSWGSQMELGDESARGINISRSSAADKSKLLEGDVLSITSSDPAGSALLAHGGLMKAERIFLILLSLSAPLM